MLERELLGATRARLHHQRQRGEEANLILQLGTVVTMDSPPSSDPGLHGLAAAAAAVRPQHLAVRAISETRRVEELQNNLERTEQVKTRPNNHILPYQFVLQDHNYGAPPPPTPPMSPVPPQVVVASSSQHHHRPLLHNMHPHPPPLTAQDLCGMAALATVADQVRAGGSTSLSMLLHGEEDSRGSLLSSDEHDDPGPEGEETETAAEGEGDEDSVTRCICDFEHDDGYMICCDKCFVWQHVDCMGIDRSNIPDEYLCELCRPRRIDRTRARNLQLRKQMHTDSTSSDDDQPAALAAQRQNQTATQARRLSAASTAAKKRQVKRETKKVVKRQRRDSAAVAAREQRVSERRANKKREMMANNNMASPSKTDSKRIPTRRRSKGKPDSVDEETQDCWGGGISSGGHNSPNTPTIQVTSVPQQPHQQLRQWIDSYEEAVTNHYSPELRARISSIKVNGVHSDYKVASSSAPKCRTSMQENGLKVLIANSSLSSNQPIIEIRGKYMLATQQQQTLRGPGRGAANSGPSPYLLFYTLPKEGTEVCVDARTYGNDARFVRSSCKPNAEVRHCIEKGALHLYLVANMTVERHSEITIKHEESGPRAHCKDCIPLAALTTTQINTPKNGLITQDSAERPERRRRGSRRTVSSEECSTPGPVVSLPTPTPESLPSSPAPVSPVEITSPPTPVTPPTPPVQSAPSSGSPMTRRAPKSPLKVTLSAPLTPAPPTPASGEDSNDGITSHDETPMSPDKRKMTREERKMEAIMKAFERLEKAQQRRQETLARQQRQHRDGIDDVDSELQDNEPLVRRPKGRRTRGRSSSSSHAASADESSLHQMSPAPSNTLSAATSPRILASPPPTPGAVNKTAAVILNNCLNFKFPKTKKVLMNEWLSKPSTEPPVSPIKMEVAEENFGRSGVAAKKRWLRQAISEESEPTSQTCSSPNSRAGSPPNGDYVTPLKKRRLARESLSSEQSFTPPTTPASDKDDARSPEEPEGGEPVPQVVEQPVKEEIVPPAAPSPKQIINAARCVEEAVMVLSADKDFLDKVIGVEAKCKDENVEMTSPVKSEPLPPIKAEVKEEVPAKSEEIPSSIIIAPVPEVKIEVEAIPPPLPPPDQPVSAPPPVEKETPAAIKRKLSISEYRQRKQRVEGDKCGMEGSESTGTLSPVSQDEEKERSAAASPSDPLLDVSEILKDGVVPSRWNSEPTALERQRENLTERLKREFGLFLDEQEANRVANLAAAAAAAGGNSTSPGTVPPSLPVTASKKQTGVSVPSTPESAISVPPPLLPILPPLQPPVVKSCDPHNVPLPPCSPPPIHDLLTEETSPPTKSSDFSILSKSDVQNGPPSSPKLAAKLFGGVQKQLLINNKMCKASKKPIPTSTPTSLQNNNINCAIRTSNNL